MRLNAWERWAVTRSPNNHRGLMLIYVCCDLLINKFYTLLRLISWNLTTRCLAVTGGGSVGECGRLSQPSWLLGVL